MVNENTRMYIPEENHQGKAGPTAWPRPWRGLRTSPPGSGSPRGTVPAELPGSPPPRPSGGTQAHTPRDRAENSRPSPSRAGFFGACVSYEIPGEGEKFPKCLLLPRFFTFAWKAQLPGPPRVGKGRRRPPTLPAGVPRFARGAAGSARAHPAPGRPRARAAARRPTGFQGPLLWAARSGSRGCRCESAPHPHR